MARDKRQQDETPPISVVVGREAAAVVAIWELIRELPDDSMRQVLRRVTEYAYERCMAQHEAVPFWSPRYGQEGTDGE